MELQELPELSDLGELYHLFTIRITPAWQVAFAE